ncbi:MAG: hypothetical protein KDD63_09760, partial [Bacteroidetes bacterium]|nr:hypothetical protein [Bacteroidota bacterium]
VNNKWVVILNNVNVLNNFFRLGPKKIHLLVRWIFFGPNLKKLFKTFTLFRITTHLLLTT